jgi:hypothetical protein
MKQKSLTTQQANESLTKFLETGESVHEGGYATFIKPLGIYAVVERLLQAINDTNNNSGAALRFAIGKCIWMLERDLGGPSTEQYVTLKDAVLERAVACVRSVKSGAVQHSGYSEEARAWNDMHLHLTIVIQDRFSKATLPPCPRT